MLLGKVILHHLLPVRTYWTSEMKNKLNLSSLCWFLLPWCRNDYLNTRVLILSLFNNPCVQLHCCSWTCHLPWFVSITVSVAHFNYCFYSFIIYINSFLNPITLIRIAILPISSIFFSGIWNTFKFLAELLPHVSLIF